MNWIKNNSTLMISLFILMLGVIYAVNFSIHDFGNYYFGAYFLSIGEFNTEIYFPHIFNQDISQLGYSGLYLNYAPNTPFLSLLFYPFTFFSIGTAKILFNVISVFLFSYSLNKWFVFFKIKPVYVVLAISIVSIPILNGLFFGQVYLLLFYLLSEGYFALLKSNNIKVGVFWSIAICLKVFPVFLLIFLVLNKKFRPFLYTILGGFILISFSLIFIDIEVWQFYFTEVLSKASNGEIYAEFVPHYQSVDELLKYLFVYNPKYNSLPFISSFPLYKSMLLVFKIFLISIGFILSKLKKDTFFQFFYWIFASILFSSYGSSYSMILLLFILLNVFKNDKTLSFKWIVSCGLIFLISNISISYFENWHFPFIKTILYLILLVLVFISVIPKIKLVYIIVPALFFSIILPNFFNKKDNIDYFTLENQPGLIYDYNVKDSKLEVRYWNSEGENIYVFKPEISTYSSDVISLIDNQIFLDSVQVTFSKDNKLKPLLINENKIIYLSDFERGFGFFNIRSIEVDI